MSKLNELWSELQEEFKEDPEYKAEAKSIELAIEINKRMKTLGFKQVDLARLLNVNKSYINQIVQGHNNMTILTICKLAHVLKMEADIGLKKPLTEIIQTASADNIIAFPNGNLAGGASDTIAVTAGKYDSFSNTEESNGTKQIHGDAISMAL